MDHMSGLIVVRSEQVGIIGHAWSLDKDAMV
jgi:hypothetical protein